VAITTYFGAQPPKSNLSNFTPPTLQSAVSTAKASFLEAITVLGTNEFESGSNAGSPNFSYTGGTATITGGTVVGPAQSPNSLGRYNMTTGLPLDPFSGGVGRGHWLEASAPFTYTFSTTIQAIGFFGTDFGDFAGSFTMELYSGVTLVGTDTLTSLNLGVNAGNGNLLFYGVTSTTPFNSAIFRVIQPASGNQTDVQGFDSLIVGNLAAAPATATVNVVLDNSTISSSVLVSPISSSSIILEDIQLSIFNLGTFIIPSVPPTEPPFDCCNSSNEWLYL
jgi:hypothetical protein